MKYKIHNDISKSEKKTRLLMFFSIGVCFCISIICMQLVYKTNESVKNQFYLIEKGQKVSAVRINDFKKAVDILCEGQIKLFHQLFFSVEPDMEFIKRNIEGKALFLIDNSGNKIYNDLVNDNYYQSVVMSRYSIEVEINNDDIQVDYSNYPYKFRVNAKQKILYKRESTYRNLITEGYIEETTVTPNNLNGLKIIDFKILNNDDIKN